MVLFAKLSRCIYKKHHILPIWTKVCNQTEDGLWGEQQGFLRTRPKPLTLQAMTTLAHGVNNAGQPEIEAKLREADAEEGEAGKQRRW